MFEKAAPVISAESARLERLLTQIESRIATAFRQFLAETHDDALIAKVSDLLERGDIQGALDIVNTHIRAFGTLFPRLYQDAAIEETKALAGQIHASVGISFDIGHPTAAALMRQNQLEFVREFTDQQAAATRDALALGLDLGHGFTPMARAFRASIGLNAPQTAAVANYRRLLRMNSSQALDRALRDRRFDPSVERAIDGGEPLDEAKIDRMVEAYRRRMLAERAETIARTESVKILSEAQEMAMAQAIDTASINVATVTQTWHCLMINSRETHIAMDGQVQPYGVPFQSPSGAQLRHPGDASAPAAEVLNCQCHRSFRIAR